MNLMKHSSVEYFFEICIATKLNGIIPCLSTVQWAKVKQFYEAPYCYGTPYPYCSLFHITIERMECFRVNAGYVLIGCPASDNTLQIVPLMPNHLQNLDILEKTEIFPNTPIKRS
jgi:hypothetical protein